MGRKERDSLPSKDMAAYFTSYKKIVQSTLYTVQSLCRSRIHKRAVSVRFLGIILRVYITNQFQTTSAQVGEGGIKSVVEETVNSKEENSKDFVPVTSKNSASVQAV